MNSFELTDLIDQLDLQRPNFVAKIIYDGAIVIDFGEESGYAPIFIERIPHTRDGFVFYQYMNDDVEGDITGIDTPGRVAEEFWQRLISFNSDELPVWKNPTGKTHTGNLEEDEVYAIQNAEGQYLLEVNSERHGVHYKWVDWFTLLDMSRPTESCDEAEIDIERISELMKHPHWTNPKLDLSTAKPVKYLIKKVNIR